MEKIGFVLVIWLTVAVGCVYQRPIVIEEPTTPRVVIREVPTEKKGAKEEKEEYFESSYLYPDMTRGYIENQAFPYLPKVWALIGGERRKILLIGPAQGPPEFSLGGIKEFNLPPGTHILHVERWHYLPHYENWQKVQQVEVVKVSIATFSRQGRRHYWFDSHYGWSVIIYPDHSVVYSGYRD